MKGTAQDVLLDLIVRSSQVLQTKNFLAQPIIQMNECNDYEAIYFCGVLKEGYLNKNPEKNNYRHNVHFIVLPQLGNSDVWEFENWKVTIKNGILERIPKTFELDDSLFKYPYDAHYFTCRIFRWMVGHFYPELIRSTIKLGKRKGNRNTQNSISNRFRI